MTVSDAACLMLLAQPATRILRLTIDDITHDDGLVLVRFGHRGGRLPEPFAALLLQAAAKRDDLQTATNPQARWLFPGRRVVSRRVPAPSPTSSVIWASPRWPDGPPRRASSSCRPRRPSSPSAGLRDNTTTRVAAEAGTPWSRYASSEQER